MLISTIRCLLLLGSVVAFQTSPFPKLAAPKQSFKLSSSTDTELPRCDQASDELGIGAWIPLASKKGLYGLGPQRIRVMNLDLVVWHTQSDSKKDPHNNCEWTAQVDACSHRLAPLSQGRVNPKTNCIECPYHGWQFSETGVVKCIPQLDESKTIESVQNNEDSNVQTFPIHAVGDLLFVFLPSSLHGEVFPQSLLPEDYYPHLAPQMASGSQVYVRDLPYSFDFLVENFMDPAHIPFAHHKLQSTRDDGIPIEMAEINSNFTHVEVSFKDITRKRKRDAYASFQRPSCYHYGEYKGDGVDEETGKKSKVPALCIWLAPVEAGKCRVFFNSPPIKLPDFLLHAGSNRFLNSDIWLHDTEREVVKRKDLSLGQSAKKLANMDYTYASKSDTGVSVFRKWWKENGLADSPPHTFSMSTLTLLGPRALSRREQIDPWENHVKHCATCRKSLKNMKRGQKGLLFLAFASGILSSRMPVVGLLSTGLSLYGRNFLKKFATALEGNYETSLLDDRSVAAIADD